jgi:protein-L-isoaspartate O-methyltransferase
MDTATTFDWTAVAAAWETNSDFVEVMKTDITARMLAALALAPGERVLELGAGTGTLAVRLAEVVGPTGHVHATDAARGMVELVARRTAGLPQVGTGVVDAADTRLPDAAYDAVVFRMGPMLVPEPERALRESRRVLVDGGRLVTSVWSGPEHNPWLVALGMAAVIHGVAGGALPTDPGGPFSLADPDRLEQLARDAGFRTVRTERVDLTVHYASAEHHFATVSALSGPLATALDAAPPDTLAAVRATAAEILAPHRVADGYVVPAQAIVCVAEA